MMQFRQRLALMAVVAVTLLGLSWYSSSGTKGPLASLQSLGADNAAPSAPRLTVQGREFLFGGRPFTIKSGSLHYFRIPELYWAQRLNAMRYLGLNTVTTYVPWNWHEPEQGRFDFESHMHDLVKFINLAGNLGLHVIVRPSPYVCAEWEWGGLPAWLMSLDPGIKVRTLHPVFKKSVEDYFAVLLPLLAPLQAVHRGPVIAFQVENEYGSYGDDWAYMSWQAELMRQHGLEELFFTSDNLDGMGRGAAPGAYQTVNFQVDPEKNFGSLEALQPNAPLMVMEYWSGWFDHWGQGHAMVPAEMTAETLERVLETGASFNLYMFHGGTNWGFWNGANMEQGQYLPTVTSYDYDAPLSEFGGITPKFEKLRALLQRFADKDDDHNQGQASAVARPARFPAAPAAVRYETVELTAGLHLFELLDEPTVRAVTVSAEDTGPLRMEDPRLKQTMGYVLYRVKGMLPVMHGSLLLRGLRDRAVVCADGTVIAAVQRSTSFMAVADDSFEVPVHVEDGVTLDVLVENMGRVNYGFLDDQSKGLLAPLAFIDPSKSKRGGPGERVLTPIESVALDFSEVWVEAVASVLDAKAGENLESKAAVTAPAVFQATFEVPNAPRDTFLLTTGWSRGVVFINGFCLGRYDANGPQRTLYLPSSLLNEGENKILVFESHEVPQQLTVSFTDAPFLS